MKKGIAVLLAALMLAGVWLVGCGERNPDELWAAAKENIVTLILTIVFEVRARKKK